MAGGDGRYKAGKQVIFRVTVEQQKYLEALAGDGTVSTALREMLDAVAALPKSEQKKLLGRAVAA